MNLHSINTGLFKLDGGAMFGVVPKSIWQKTNPADENNMCTWAMRCLLIEEGDRLILVDTGIGSKQDSKFLGFFHLHGTETLQKSLNEKGFSPEDITDVLLTHLHFDHCGGALNYNKDRSKIIPTFSNATYWSNQEHWNWALAPNAREKASFLKENLLPLQESGQLKFMDDANNPLLGIGYTLLVDGHTEKQMIPHIRYQDKTIVFTADLLPSVGHIPLPYIMAYDTRPLLTLKEKEMFLNDAVSKKYILFFEHDSINECCTLKSTEKGIKPEEIFLFKDIL